MPSASSATGTTPRCSTRAAASSPGEGSCAAASSAPGWVRARISAHSAVCAPGQITTWSAPTVPSMGASHCTAAARSSRVPAPTW
ncbi:hypothetical protein G6F54_014403 [Rhizopus delemar]|nr:hypothetical protein G6F54_014403 [Rhizopus delemar]